MGAKSLLLCAALQGVVLLAKPTRFDFRDLGGRNLIHFTSDALLEKTVGLTTSVAGWVELDPENLSEPIRGEISLDTRTFHTGLEARNELVREKLVSENPIALYVPEKISNSSKKILADGETVTARVQGALTLKGVTRPQSALVKLTYFKENENTRRRLSGNLLKVSATLDLDTPEFLGPIPAGQQAFFSRFVQVGADIVGSDLAPSPSLSDVISKPPLQREPTAKR